MEPILIGQKIRFNLYDAIEEFEDYESFFANMLFYDENDHVDIHINCPGGRLDVGGSIVDHIRSCKARVTCIVEQPSYSMGAMIALSGDSLIMNPRSFLMFHNYSSGVSGKGSEISQMVSCNEMYFNQMLDDLCSPFLTKQELDRIKRDHDVYIFGNDPLTKARIKRHFK